MDTVTKKDLIDRIADRTGNKRVVVKRIIQSFLDDIIDEMLVTRTSERSGRLIDNDEAASMEKKKREGYF